MLRERNESLYMALAEIVEDIALARAIEEGETTADVSRDELYQLQMVRQHLAGVVTWLQIDKTTRLLRNMSC